VDVVETEPKKDLNPLAPGVWITEATGFAAVPPRAQSDLAEVCDENEKKKEEKAEGEAEPRIERYPER
jgi:hypothetical protein